MIFIIIREKMCKKNTHKKQPLKGDCFIFDKSLLIFD
tara:strand:+ start:141 stop:251 length:111 start_codon:yes stop_codon:yes gene_type:complete